jgi:hypothetical protein
LIGRGKHLLLDRFQALDLARELGIAIRSYFQTDSVGLKLRWPISWALRDPRGVAFLTGANW